MFCFMYGGILPYYCFAGNLLLRCSRVMWNQWKLFNGTIFRNMIPGVQSSNMSFIIILSQFKRLLILTSYFMISSSSRGWNGKRYTFASRVHIIYLKCMIVSAAARACTNRVLNKTSPGMVRFFRECVCTNYFPLG